MAAIDSVCRHHEKIALANRGRPCMDPRLRGDFYDAAPQVPADLWTTKKHKALASAACVLVSNRCALMGLLLGEKLDPRLRGDDVVVSNRCALMGLLLDNDVTCSGNRRGRPCTWHQSHQIVS